MKLPITLAALAVTLLASSSHAGIFDKAKNNPKDADPNAALTVADHLKIKGKHRLASGSKVAIANFYVQFVRDQTVERAGRVGSDSYTTQVRGIEDSNLQQIANDLYDAFVAELQTNGIEVIPIETLEANKSFAEIRKSARVSPFIEESSTGGGKRDEQHQGVSVLVSAKNLPINLRFSIDDYWLKGNASDGFKMSLVTEPIKLATQLEASVLDVRLTMAFAALKGTVSNSGGGSYNIGSATATNASVSSFRFDADLYPRFVNGGNLINIITAKGTTTAVLEKPVLIKDLTFNLEKGNGTGSRGSGLLGALGRAVGGQKDADADAYIQFQADNFSEQVKARGSELTKLFIEGINQP